MRQDFCIAIVTCFELLFANLRIPYFVYPVCYGQRLFVKVGQLFGNRHETGNRVIIFLVLHVGVGACENSVGLGFVVGEDSGFCRIEQLRYGLVIDTRYGISDGCLFFRGRTLEREND